MKDNHSEPRGKCIYSKPSAIKEFLELFPVGEILNHKALLEKARKKFRGGTFTAVKKDAKILKLIEGSDGRDGTSKVSETGISLLKNFTSEQLKQIALKEVPAFKEMYLRDITNRIDAEKYMKEVLDGHYTEGLRKHYVSQGALRYLEYVHGDTTHTRAVKSRKSKKNSFVMDEKTNIEAPTSNSWVKSVKLVVTLQQLKQEYTKQDIDLAWKELERVH